MPTLLDSAASRPAGCAPTAAHAFALLDGTLPPDAVARLEAHLAACPACRARVTNDRRFLAMLRGRRLRLRAPDTLRARARALADAFVGRTTATPPECP